MINMKKLFFSLLVLSLSICAQAQRGWEIGGWLGTSHYFGDLNTEYKLTDIRFAGGIGARYNFNQRICLQFSGNQIGIAGDDADSENEFERQRNLSFENRIWDGTVQLEFNFLPYEHGSSKKWFTPYMLAGFSFYRHNPTAELEGEKFELQGMGTEGQFLGEEYSLNGTAFTFGGGFKFDINYRWSVNIFITSRKSYSDYIDDVSGTYADTEDIENLRGPSAALLSDRSREVLQGGQTIGEPGRQRGNGRNNDIYASLGVGLMYYFGQIRCPEFSRY